MTSGTTPEGRTYLGSSLRASQAGGDGSGRGEEPLGYAVNRKQEYLEEES